MEISAYSRVSLAHLPTPLEPLGRLSSFLGGPELFIKRDDCTGLAMGGNKARKLEFLLAEAGARGADTIITAGGTQSNHVRQTAAAAARLGFACTVVLERIDPDVDESYAVSGNAFLDALAGARIVFCPAGADVDAAMEALTVECRENGGNPYQVAVGGSSPSGVLGYVECANELFTQCRALRIRTPAIVLPSGSGGTQAGLLLGLASLGWADPVIGVCVSREREAQETKVYELLRRTVGELALEIEVPREAVVALDDYVGRGYGFATESMREALTLTARHEGILLDPVYTGKAMAGLIGLIRSGELASDRPVVFLHTGGAPALFAYGGSF